MTNKKGRLLQIIGDADDASKGGKERLAADLYLNAFTKYPRQYLDDDHRYNVFRLYTLTIQSEQVQDTLADQKALQNIGDDPRFPVIFRSEALKTLGILQAHRGDRDSSAMCCRKAINLIENVSEKEKKRIMTKRRKQKPAYKRVNDVLCRCREDTQDILHNMEGWIISRASHKNEKVKGKLHTEFVRSSRLLPKKDLAELLPRLNAGGNACDCCGITAQQLGVTTLDACSQCFMTYYCSSECQTKAWNAGHKSACRRPKEIQVGDIMQLPSLDSMTGGPKQILLAKALNKDPKREGCWQVELLVDKGAFISGMLSVSASALKHIRPAK